METLLLDFRYAARRLAKSPGFTAIAVLTLALGIGANSAIFSVVHAVLLRPLPYPDADRLVQVFHTTEGRRSSMSPANFRDVREQSRSLEDLSFFTTPGTTLTGAGDAARLQAAAVGANYFRVLRAEPLLGRVFHPDENEPGRHRAAVLSYGLWQQRFGGEPGIVGRSISLDGEPHVVVGVMPRGFSYPSERDIWIPYQYDPYFASDDSRGAWYISPIGRLKPDATVAQLNREVETLAKRLEQEFPQTNTGLGFAALSLFEVTVGNVRTALLVLLGAVGFVLLIACANVANLLLARSTVRQGEFAVRTALGAGRARLVRQLLTESVLLGVLGGASGLLLAVWGTELLVALEPEGIPRLEDVRVDATLVGFTAVAAVVTGLLFGLVPAIQTTRGNVATTLREGGRGAVSSQGSVRSALVVSQMALAVMLLTGAGLLIKSFVRLQQVDPGFQSSGALSFRVGLPRASYPTDAERWGAYEQMVARLEALPGVASVGGVMFLPMSGSSMGFAFQVAGREPAAPGEEPSAQTLPATAGYFGAMGIPILRGRGFTARDRADSPPVLVISEATARTYFPNEDPLDKHITLTWLRDSLQAGGKIVGVVGDVRQFGMEVEPAPAIYLPYSQVPVEEMSLVVRTSVPPLTLAGVVEREVEAVDPNLPLQDVRPLEALVSESVSQPRFYTLLLSTFAAVAVLLASIGIFGVISYSVTRRTREIGVRIALGADPRSVVKLVVGGALGLAGAGVGLGVLGALAGTRVLSGLLFGVETTDPLTYVSVSLVLYLVAVLASYLPVRRAIRVDPNVALRLE